MRGLTFPAVSQKIFHPGNQDIPISRKHIAILGLVITFIGSLSFVISTGYDWNNAILPWTQAALQGKNPYAEVFFVNPPWTLALTIPFALLPQQIGGKLYCLACTIAFFVGAVRLGAKPSGLLLFFFSPLVIHAINLGNFDGWVALGMTLPPQIGLFLVMLKPQVGLGIAIYWLIASYRAGGVRKVLQVFLPVTMAYLVSFVFFGLFLFTKSEMMVALPNNVSIWPWGIPIGILLLGIAIRKFQPDSSMLSGLFFSPYIGIASLALIPFSIIKHSRASVVFFLVVWFSFIYLLIAGQ